MSDNEKEGEILKVFGRYLLLDHLVSGGMAKICRARTLGEEADKIVAIKMIQNQYSKDEAFRTMFMDEIKVTFGLNHPHVAQTYDYGIHEGTLFTAMEYVDGKNLKQFLEKLRKRNFVFPVQISVHIISQVCQGLHYAHTFTDKLTAVKSNIIHRDISPHNIMITYDGSTKVIDFGIAKAETNSDSTKAGTIKGKLSYLAPEYLDGMTLDHRYDQFSTGITLWEMLCCRKLFKAPNELAVLKQIQACKIAPPSSINPNVPKELDEIVLRALSKDREKRFDNMEQMNRALVKFLYSNFPEFNATDLAYFARELFKDDIEEDRKKLFQFGKINISEYIEEMKQNEANKSIQTANVSSDATQTRKETVLDFGFEGKKESATKARKTAAGKISPAGAGDKARPVARKGNRPKPGDKARTNARTRSTTVTKVNKFNPMIAAGIAALVVIGGIIFSMGGDSEPTVVVDPKPTTPTRTVASVEAKVRFKNYSSLKHSVFIDGRLVNVTVLGDLIKKLRFGTKYTLRVESKGLRHFIKEFVITKEEPEISITIPSDNSRETEAYGYMITSEPCAKGTIYFNLFGEERAERVPVRGGGIALPVILEPSGKMLPRDYEMYFEYDDRKNIKKKIEFTVRYENDAVDLCRYF